MILKIIFIIELKFVVENLENTGKQRDTLFFILLLI